MRYGDVLAAKIAVQLNWIPAADARAHLQALDEDPRNVRDFVNRLSDAGHLDDEQVETVRHRVALYEHVWLEDCYLRGLEQRCKIPKRVVVDLMLALEKQAYRRRVGVELTRVKKLTPELDASILANAQASLDELVQVDLDDARSNGFEEVADPLIANCALDPTDFKISTLFRSVHTQALLDKRKLAQLRAEADAPPAIPDATPAPRRLTPAQEDRTATVATRPPALDDPQDTTATVAAPVAEVSAPRPKRKRKSSNPLDLERIGPYAVVDTLGVGGMGAVYLCRDEQNPDPNAYLAVKVLLKDVANDVNRGRFAREIKLTTMVEHEHVIDVIDHGETDDGLSYLVVPALWGEELRESLNRAEGAGLRPGLALHIFEQLLHALAACHAQQIVHRDLKPENVFVLSGGKFDVKLLDFGVAKFQDEAYDTASSFVTANREVVGTPAYLSPDAITNDTIDGRTDLYSLGIMFFEMLTGELPITSRTPQGFLAQHLVCPPTTLEESRPDLDWPPALQDLLDSMLGKSRKKRPESCAAILALLDAGLRKEIQRLDPSATETLPPDYHEEVEPKPGFLGLLGRLKA